MIEGVPLVMTTCRLENLASPTAMTTLKVRGRTTFGWQAATTLQREVPVLSPRVVPEQERTLELLKSLGSARRIPTLGIGTPACGKCPSTVLATMPLNRLPPCGMVSSRLSGDRIWKLGWPGSCEPAFCVTSTKSTDP